MTQRFGLTLAFSTLFALLSASAPAVTWLPFGPDGGDARSFAADPHDPKHLYLGAVNGWIFESHDGGRAWKRLARVGKRDDLVLDNIVVDAANANHIIVGAWVLGSDDGGLFVSKDAGVTWSSIVSMAGQSIRSLTASSSDPKTILAGTLKGVYRSVDGGEKWQLISPDGSHEIHEVESIAIDPNNPKIIYAGTWHLPWKSTDGGENWKSIKEGIIEDSDVFSIIVDPTKPSVIYASACSGIYKSDSAGEKFKKIQGIPSTARRTRVLMQDPKHLETVYAGTTEGLFRSDDSGATWVRTTGPEVIVNDVYVDPTDSTHVLLATDRGGVLTSHDRGNSFAGSNAGFSARQITSYVADARHPSNVFVGLVNDKEWGGVYASDNGGLTWFQQSSGLGGKDVFSLGQASDGTIIAGTAHGFYRSNGGMWSRAGDGPASALVQTKPMGKKVGKPVTPVKRSTSADKSAKAPFDGSVYSITRDGDVLYAATSEGLMTSNTAGEKWSRVAGADRRDLVFVSASRRMIVAGGLKSMILSEDGGKTWAAMSLPNTLTQVAGAAVDSIGAVWVGGREGLFATRDRGATWEGLKNLNIHDVNSVFFDAASERVVITSGGANTIAFAIHVPERTVKFWDTGWNLRFVRPVGDHMIGATLFDGVVIQPQMVDSAEISAKSEVSARNGKE